MEEAQENEMYEEFMPRGANDRFILLAALPDMNTPSDVMRHFYAYLGSDAATSNLRENEVALIQVGAGIIQDIDFMQYTPEEVDIMPHILKVNQQIEDLAFLRLKKSENGTLLTNAIKSIVEHVTAVKNDEQEKRGFLARITGRL